MPPTPPTPMPPRSALPSVAADPRCSGPRVIALVASLAAAVAPGWLFYCHVSDSELFMLGLIYTAALAATGLLALVRSVGALLFARSVWWSAFGLAALVVLFARHETPLTYVMFGMQAATAVALLASRRIKPPRSGTELTPVAYRGAITLSMIMALADAQALGWLGLTQLFLRDIDGIQRFGLPGAAMLGAACIAMIALYGLYKLRLWGLVLSTLTTAAIGALAFTPVFGMRGAGPLPYAFALSAVVQIALLTPLFAAIVRRRAPAPPSPRSQQLAQLAPVALILLVTALSISLIALGRPLIRM